MTKSHRSHASVQPRRHHHERRHNRATVLAWLSCLCLAATLTACGGGGGGSDDDGGGPDTPASQAGLTFTYPVDGQQDVYVKSQVVLSFDASAGGFDSLANSLTLVADGTPVNTVVTQDANQPNIFHLQVAAPGDSIERPGLQPSTDYAVAASGGTLITFSTRALDGHPSPGGNFSVEHYTSIGNVPVPFTVFNPIRAHFSQPVNAGTVNLCRGGETLGTDCTVKVSGPGGNVPGTLMILGSDMTFDPDDGTDTNGTLDPANYTGDLQAGKTYTVAFDGVESVFGDTLNTAFNVTPVSIGQDVVKALVIEPTMNKTVDSPLDGRTRNVAHIVSQLIGVNNQDAKAAPQRGGVLTRLAEPSDASRYQGTFPAVIPAGQKFQLAPIHLKLGGDKNTQGVNTPLITGPIQSWFVNDASVYIVGNSLSGLKTPTMVLMRLDMAISSKADANDAIETMGNGVFNQTVLNVVAAGTAIPQPNGDVKLVTMGSFPASVNRTGNAITDFELEVTLPNPKAGNPPSIGSDQTPPRITGVFPSACLYTFQTPGFVKGGAIPGEPGSTTLSDIERDCRDVMSQRTIVQTNDPGAPDATMNFPHSYPNGLPLNASPSIIFSEPVDPASLEGNIVLADGCLIGGAGSSAATEGSFAVQIMDGSGHCTDVVDGAIATLTPGAELTRGFTFRPTQPFEPGQRYWIVICGAPNSNEPAAGTSQCVTSGKIVDRAGRPLNTNPLYSTGTKASGRLDAGEAPDGTRLSRCPGRPPVASLPNPTHPLGGTMNCWDQVASGGPDLVMPFDAVAPTRDFYAVTRALPTADTNGNGFFDNSSTNVDYSNPPLPALIIGGTNTGEERGRSVPFNDALGAEHAQMANSLFIFPTSNGEDPMDAGFLSGAQQVAIGTLAAGHDCSAAAEVMLQNGTPNDPSDDVSVTGGVPAHCVPVSLLPGSYKVISNIPAQAGTLATGRILLRFPGADVDGDNVVDHPQKGYIVPECQGVIKTPKRALPAVDVTNPFTNQPDLSTQPVMLEQPFHYAPCFVANLTITAQTIDRGVPGGIQLISQQNITVQAFGPVAFQQNGRMVISNTNANRFYLQSYMIAMPRVYTFPGRQHLQLVGPAVHGGRAFPMR